jgi:hypothetical protein
MVFVSLCLAAKAYVAHSISNNNRIRPHHTNRRSEVGSLRPLYPCASFQAFSEAKSGSFRQNHPCEVGNCCCASEGFIRRQADALPAAALQASRAASYTNSRQVLDGYRTSHAVSICIYRYKTSQRTLRIRGVYRLCVIKTAFNRLIVVPFLSVRLLPPLPETSYNPPSPQSCRCTPRALSTDSDLLC